MYVCCPRDIERESAERYYFDSVSQNAPSITKLSKRNLIENTKIWFNMGALRCKIKFFKDYISILYEKRHRTTP